MSIVDLEDKELECVEENKPETPLVIEHGGLRLEFFKDSTTIIYDCLPEYLITSVRYTGEDAIQNLMLTLFRGQAETSEQFQNCMKSVREFYSHYLMDKSALNMLAWQLKNMSVKNP